MQGALARHGATAGAKSGPPAVHPELYAPGSVAAMVAARSNCPAGHHFDVHLAVLRDASESVTHRVGPRHDEAVAAAQAAVAGGKACRPCAAGKFAPKAGRQLKCEKCQCQLGWHQAEPTACSCKRSFEASTAAPPRANTPRANGGAAGGGGGSASGAVEPPGTESASGDGGGPGGGGAGGSSSTGSVAADGGAAEAQAAGYDTEGGTAIAAAAPAVATPALGAKTAAPETETPAAHAPPPPSPVNPTADSSGWFAGCPAGKYHRTLTAGDRAQCGECPQGRYVPAFGFQNECRQCACQQGMEQTEDRSACRCRKLTFQETQQRERDQRRRRQQQQEEARSGRNGGGGSSGGGAGGGSGMVPMALSLSALLTALAGVAAVQTRRSQVEQGGGGGSGGGAPIAHAAASMALSERGRAAAPWLFQSAERREQVSPTGEWHLRYRYRARDAGGGSGSDSEPCRSTTLTVEHP
jgi:hypothetical protein